MIALITTVLSAAVIVVADTTGGLPPWATLVLTPTVVVGLLISGTLVRGKDYEAATKRAEAWEARCNAAEERERQTYAVAIPAIQASSRVSEESARATSRMVAYLERQGQS